MMAMTTTRFVSLIIVTSVFVIVIGLVQLDGWKFGAPPPAAQGNDIGADELGASKRDRYRRGGGVFLQVPWTDIGVSHGREDMLLL